MNLEFQYKKRGVLLNIEVQISNRGFISENAYLADIMKEDQKNNPLHGKTLEMILNHLVETYGWERLGEKINIKCFTINPSIKSSLVFLRKTPWAREKVEALYIK